MKTKSITVTKLRSNLSSVLNAINKDNPIQIISRYDKQEHVIVDIDKFEDLLALNDPQYIKEIAQARRQIFNNDVLILKDAFHSS